MTIHFTLTPGIENRLSAWNNYARIASKHKSPESPCITISREFGCQGYPVAQALERRLNKEENEDKWIVLDRLLLEKIAEESGFSKTDIERVGDRNPVFDAILTPFMGEHQAVQFEVFSYIKKAIRHFAKVGRCIIVGRGAVTLTQDYPNCMHFRLVAPLEFRVKNVMEVQNLSEDESKEFIETHHKQRDKFIHDFTQKSVDDPTLYHLIINNARYTTEQIADLIVKYLFENH